MATTYRGKILRINLSTGKVSTESLDISFAKKFIGGRGLGTKILMDEIDPKVDPLSEGNKLFFVTGPATGTKISTGGRFMVITKSPLNGLVACSNSGGVWGAKLKYAGYDVMIIEGKSSTPKYINIEDDKVELCDAKHLWNMDTTKVEETLKEKYKEGSVLNIGPAGESMSLMAAIMNDTDRAAGRSGVGAVMGSKNLKAIVVATKEQNIDAPNVEAYKQLSAVLAKRLKENGVTGTGLPTYGTAVLVNIMNGLGSYPTNNWQGSSFGGTETACGEYMTEKYLKGQHYCHRCTIGCGRVVEREGKKIGGPEYETIWAFSADLGIKDFDTVVEANYLCNEMGLDTISTGCTIAAAMELYQKGYIKKEECGNIPLEFGNSKSAIEWIKKIGRPDSELAKNMAKGSHDLCKHYGHPEISMSVKKLEMPAYDARGVQGIGLNYATTNRGGCHVRGYTISPEVLGVPSLVDRTTTEGKALLVKTTQDFTAIIDSLGLCLFTSFELKLKDYTDIFNAITESNLKEEELLEVGERIYNLERLFNQKAGMSPSEDKLPKRLLEEAIDNMESKGMVNKLGVMLPEYYKVRGWENAFPTSATLKRLGL